MFPVDSGKIVAELCAPNRFVNGWLDEEGISKPETWAETNTSIRWDLGWSSRSRPELTLVAEVCFVQLGRGDRGVLISIDDVDFRWSLDSVRRIPVRRHVERLISVFRIVEIIGHSELIRWINIPVEAAQRSRISNGMLHWLAVVLPYVCLDKIKQSNALAFSTAIDEGFVDRIGDYRVWIRASGAECRAQIGARQLCDNLFKCPKDEHFVF